MSIETNIPKDPSGEPHRIKELFAFIMDLPEEGGEGIPAMATKTPRDGHPYAMPLIGSDRARIESIRDAAQACADEKQKEIVLCKFKERVEVERIKPRSKEVIEAELKAKQDAFNKNLDELLAEMFSKGEPKKGEIKDEYELKTVCPYCGYHMDAHTVAEGEPAIPTEGSVGLCLRCGEFPMFKVVDGKMTMVIPSDAEKAALPIDVLDQMERVHKAWEKREKIVKHRMEERYGKAQS